MGNVRGLDFCPGSAGCQPVAFGNCAECKFSKSSD
jgi:hypothetical protein